MFVLTEVTRVAQDQSSKDLEARPFYRAYVPLLLGDTM